MAAAKAFRSEWVSLTEKQESFLAANPKAAYVYLLWTAGAEASETKTRAGIGKQRYDQTLADLERSGFLKRWPNSRIRKGLDRSRIASFHERHYVASNLLVSVAGNVEHDRVIELAMKYLKPHKGSKQPFVPAPGPSATPNKRNITGGKLALTPFREVVRRPSEQVHILVGFPGADFRDRLRFEGYIVNTLLGGGMTSRLYQSIREDRGLVYSIYSQLSTFSDTGLNLIYAGTEPKHAPEVLELIMKELKRLKKKGVTKSDVQLFKTQVLGSILLGSDDIENRMNSIAVNEMMFGRYRSVDQVMRDVEAVSVDSVHEYIETWVDLDKLGILLMGALPEAPTKKWLNTL